MEAKSKDFNSTIGSKEAQLFKIIRIKAGT
jgi:hypothetical protein